MKNFLDFLYDTLFGHYFILKAYFFAKKAHQHQKRKYTNEPYFSHCLEVYREANQYNSHWTSKVAALLHDVVEDVEWTSIDLIASKFGGKAASKVASLTNCDKSLGNRATRCKIDNHRLQLADEDIQNIKLCDIKSNCKSIFEHDKKFARVYIEEKLQQAELLTKANKELRQNVLSELHWYHVQLKELK